MTGSTTKNPVAAGPLKGGARCRKFTQSAETQGFCPFGTGCEHYSGYPSKCSAHDRSDIPRFDFVLPISENCSVVNTGAWSGWTGLIPIRRSDCSWRWGSGRDCDSLQASPVELMTRAAVDMEISEAGSHTHMQNSASDARLHAARHGAKGS